MIGGLFALGAGILAVGPAGAAPTSNLVFSVDGGTTWSANVNAVPGQTVIAREYYDNDTSSNITGASVTTTLPSGFSLVAGSTEVCLNPGTTNPTNPSSELECNTQTGGAAPTDEGGPIDEASVWSGSNLTISPTAGLFGQPVDGTSGILAAGKVRYINLDNCVYTNGINDNYTNIVNDTTNASGAFDAGTNASDTATAESCAAGAGGYGHNGSSVQNIDLLGQATLNLDDCNYFDPTLGDTIQLFDTAQGSATNAANTAQSSPTCTESLGGYSYQSFNSGVAPLDLLDNQYVNLNECSYSNGEIGGHDNFSTAVDITNMSPTNNAGTNASNTPQSTVDCGAGNADYAYVPSNSAVEVLNTLDTTRGQGFVQWSMTAPSPGSTTTYTENGQLIGSGTGDPVTSGTITIDASVGTPLANPWVLGGGLCVLILAGGGVALVRRRRTEIES